MINFIQQIFDLRLLGEMVQNVVSFLFWLLNFIVSTLYTCLVVLPIQLLKLVFNFALAPLHPVFATCTESGCVVNDIGRAVVVVLVLLGIVGLLKWQSRRYKNKE